jgi:hypothetical protein
METTIMQKYTQKNTENKIRTAKYINMETGRLEDLEIADDGYPIIGR